MTNRSPKGKRKTKTVNQDVVREIGPMSYPGRSHGQGILVNFKISDSTLVAKKVNHENSDEVIVCAKKTLSCFTQYSMNIVCKVLVYSEKSIAWQSLTNSHYQVLEVEIVRLDLSVGQGVVKIEIENEV